MKWRHGCFECSKADVMVLWIFVKWPHGYFEYLWGDVIGILNTHEVTLWRYSEADVMGVLKYSKLHDFFWIFKISWHHFKNNQNTYVTMNIQNIHVTFKITLFQNTRIFQKTHDVSFWIFQWRPLWIFKIPMTSLHEFSKCLMSNLNIRKLTPWVFWKFRK